MPTPYSTHVYEEVTSTQDVARELSEFGPVLVVASRQTAGRGRSGAAWETAPRALAMSLRFDPFEWPSDRRTLIPLATGIAVARLWDLALKWPNDLLLPLRREEKIVFLPSEGGVPERSKGGGGRVSPPGGGSTRALRGGGGRSIDARRVVSFPAQSKEEHPHRAIENAPLPASPALPPPGGETEDKVGGILAEASGREVTIGIGLNLWWLDPPADRIGLFPEDPGPSAYTAIASELAESVWAELAKGPERWSYDEYCNSCATLGRKITWGDGHSGTALAIDRFDGALIVEDANGDRLNLKAGEIRHVRASPDPR
ncbi:MAG: biotin--[acetyl-CoA-carboxylase] ligase [Acidimicrobiia bacterium]